MRFENFQRSKCHSERVLVNFIAFITYMSTGDVGLRGRMHLTFPNDVQKARGKWSMSNWCDKGQTGTHVKKKKNLPPIHRNSNFIF